MQRDVWHLVCTLSSCKEHNSMCSFSCCSAGTGRRTAACLSCEDSLVTLRICKELRDSRLTQKVDFVTQGSSFPMKTDQAAHLRVCSNIINETQDLYNMLSIALQQHIHALSLLMTVSSSCSSSCRGGGYRGGRSPCMGGALGGGAGSCCCTRCLAGLCLQLPAGCLQRLVTLHAQT